MANYSIAWSCGHTQDKQLYGKMTSRESYIAWAAQSGACSACRVSDETAAVEAVEREHDVAPLKGSVKQIAWARTIRAAQLRDVVTSMAAMAARVPADKIGEYEQQRDTLMVKLASQTAASWWIDARTDDARALIRRATKG